MIRYAKITPNSYVDGPGKRTVIFLQGCTIACPGCQNKALWSTLAGNLVDEVWLAKTAMLNGNPNITISGGEPTEQLPQLNALVKALRAYGAEHIIVYTGRTFEWLIENKLSDFMNLCLKINILVDGPFIKEQDDPFITWRGSRNQRPIDCKATRETRELVVLDWSQPEIQIDENGSLHLPAGLAEDFAEAGETMKSRMCGQTK
jgi:anaerobic ribonucleoside-triphosphate reductase activating protein